MVNVLKGQMMFEVTEGSGIDEGCELMSAAAYLCIHCRWLAYQSTGPGCWSHPTPRNHLRRFKLGPEIARRQHRAEWSISMLEMIQQTGQDSMAKLTLM